MTFSDYLIFYLAPLEGKLALIGNPLKTVKIILIFLPFPTLPCLWSLIMNLTLILFAVFNQQVLVPEQMIQFILIGTNSDEVDSICQASKSLNGLQQPKVFLH